MKGNDICENETGKLLTTLGPLKAPGRAAADGLKFPVKGV